MARLFLFDIDGTLIDGDGAGRASLARAVSETLGSATSLDGVSLAGNTDAAIVLDVLARAGHPARLGDERFNEVKRRYLAGLAGCVEKAAAKRVLPGVSALLERLRARGHPIGLATGNFREGARAKLAWCGLWDRFPVGGFGDERIGRADLVRDAIEAAEAHWGASFRPRDVLVIGDTPKDVASGKAVGAATLAVATGIHTLEELAATGPDVLLADFGDTEAVGRAIEI